MAGDVDEVGIVVVDLVASVVVGNYVSTMEYKYNEIVVHRAQLYCVLGHCPI